MIFSRNSMTYKTDLSDSFFTNKLYSTFNTFGASFGVCILNAKFFKE